jgi:hypothetical protein
MRITTTNKYQQPLMTTPYAGNADGYNQLYTIEDASQLEQANTHIQSVSQENALNMQEAEMEVAQSNAGTSQIVSAGSSFALNKGLASAGKGATAGAKAGALMKSGFGYGAIAYGVGELIGSQVDDGDAGTYTGQEKTADFISNAGQGAMVGSYFGPWGAAIGAVGYGLYGLWKGNKDADKVSAEQEKAKKSMTAANLYRQDQQRKLLTISGSNTGQEEPTAGPGY